MKFNKKDREEKDRQIEDKYGYLRSDLEFLDYVSDLLWNNANKSPEWAFEMGFTNWEGDLDNDKMDEFIQVQLEEPGMLEEFAEEYFEKYPDRKFKNLLPKEVIDNYKSIMDTL